MERNKKKKTLFISKYHFITTSSLGPCCAVAITSSAESTICASSLANCNHYQTCKAVFDGFHVRRTSGKESKDKLVDARSAMFHIWPLRRRSGIFSVTKINRYIISHKNLSGLEEVSRSLSIVAWKYWINSGCFLQVSGTSKLNWTSQIFLCRIHDCFVSAIDTEYLFITAK